MAWEKSLKKIKMLQRSQLRDRTFLPLFSSPLGTFLLFSFITSHPSVWFFEWVGGRRPFSFFFFFFLQKKRQSASAVGSFITLPIIWHQLELLLHIEGDFRNKISQIDFELSELRAAWKLWAIKGSLERSFLSGWVVRRWYPRYIRVQ